MRYTPDINGDWPYFKRSELQCSHTKKCNMAPQTMNRLITLRKMLNKPIIITSAYRDKTHPLESSKYAPGAHSRGRAVDISCSGRSALRILNLALQCGFTGIGINQKGKHRSRYIHLDDMTNKEGFPRPTIWSY